VQPLRSRIRQRGRATTWTGLEAGTRPERPLQRGPREARVENASVLQNLRKRGIEPRSSRPQRDVLTVKLLALDRLASQMKIIINSYIKRERGNSSTAGGVRRAPDAWRFSQRSTDRGTLLEAAGAADATAVPIRRVASACFAAVSGESRIHHPIFVVCSERC
jgi:hypothetical protein